MDTNYTKINQYIEKIQLRINEHQMCPQNPNWYWFLLFILWATYNGKMWTFGLFSCLILCRDCGYFWSKECIIISHSGVTGWGIMKNVEKNVEKVPSISKVFKLYTNWTKYVYFLSLYCMCFGIIHQCGHFDSNKFRLNNIKEIECLLCKSNPLGPWYSSKCTSILYVKKQKTIQLITLQEMWFMFLMV